MSEELVAPVSSSVSAGALLREARERTGMHIGALAVGLKVPVKKIEALEADRLDLLPDAVFARALASSIARTLKVDPVPILAALPQGQTSRLSVGGSVSLMNTYSAGGAAWSPFLGLLKKPAVLVGILLVVGALALVFVPMGQTPSANQSTISNVPNSSPGAQMGSDTSPVTQGMPTPPVVGQASSETGLSTNSPLRAMPPASALVESTTTVGSGVEVQAKAGNTGLIRLNASGPTWVEVTDATGVVQLRKTLAAGESTSAGGTLPLKVVVGRVDMTQVEVQGKPFDMTPFGKDNVARFEVR
jgi:cytoskeleton protein RodZ